MTPLFSACFLCLCFLVVSAAPEKSSADSRAHSGKLSDQEHYDKDGKHNEEYDREAFLGKEKKSFDQLTPEESKERLGKIVDKIDKDSDGSITEKELEDWIRFTRMQNHYDQVDKRWKDLKKREKNLVSRKDFDGDKNVDPDGPVSWEIYKTISFGKNPEKHQDHVRLLKQMSIDERRWKRADLNQDNKLSKEEYGAFYQPWEHEHMYDVVAQEHIEEMDKDKDGRASLQEYLDDIHKKPEKEMTGEELEKKENDKKYFHLNRDANKDGFLDREEMKEWMFPTSYNYVQAEASHLIHHADSNQDKVLAKDEILNKYNIFVGSRATNFGSDLTRHDEF